MSHRATYICNDFGTRCCMCAYFFGYLTPTKHILWFFYNPRMVLKNCTQAQNQSNVSATLEQRPCTFGQSLG